ncbi:hypothetical protein ES319_A11G346900v1 [Gossypium barbadense]|uniref:Secreted protein n=2 Tax=Gossypium TaxID=3633 RepID=A0A5J5TVM6_GOSBA|nr:hypothetical protein ES319_A11G346900v1 [Gossypium barbadense]TYI03963.1 hypothetical protein ES332_A11G380500v1 [Gossypium tomentosum]
MKLARCPSKWLYYMLCFCLYSSVEHSIHYKQQRPYFLLRLLYLSKYSNKTKRMMMVMPYVWPFCKTCTGISQWLCG